MTKKNNVKILVILLGLVFLTGCISSSNKTTAAAVQYVTPCDVASKGIQVRIDAKDLTTTDLKEQLEKVFVDDFNSPSGKDIKPTYKLNCYWGSQVGERRDYYYCKGSYKSPELDDSQVIRRYLWKVFKIGFDVEEHALGSWVDSAGKVHDGSNVFYLTIRSVTATCSVAPEGPGVR